ncbi:MAG: hypothetical protein RIC14_15570 [Filomicrobium sp.]
MSLRRGFLPALGAICALATACNVLGAGHAAAERISVDDCKQYATEREKLSKSDLPKDMEKGPQWAKANLSPDRIRLIGRYIYLEEQLEFRCPDLLAAAAVRQMEEQARLRALAKVERERKWLEKLKKVVPPVRKPKTKLARAKPSLKPGIPPLPERKSR